MACGRPKFIVKLTRRYRFDSPVTGGRSVEDIGSNRKEQSDVRTRHLSLARPVG
jgi:hypothetical protein